MNKNKNQVLLDYHSNFNSVLAKGHDNSSLAGLAAITDIPPLVE